MTEVHGKSLLDEYEFDCLGFLDKVYNHSVP